MSRRGCTALSESLSGTDIASCGRGDCLRPIGGPSVASAFDRERSKPAFESCGRREPGDALRTEERQATYILGRGRGWFTPLTTPVAQEFFWRGRHAAVAPVEVRGLYSVFAVLDLGDLGVGEVRLNARASVAVRNRGLLSVVSPFWGGRRGVSPALLGSARGVVDKRTSMPDRMCEGCEDVKWKCDPSARYLGVSIPN